MNKVIIYGSASCTFCDTAKKLAKSVCKNVIFKDIQYKNHYSELIEKEVPMEEQPLIFIEVDEEEWFVGTYPSFKQYVYREIRT